MPDLMTLLVPPAAALAGVMVGIVGNATLQDRQRRDQRRDERHGLRHQLYEELLVFVYDFERITDRGARKEEGSETLVYEDELAKLTLPLRARLTSVGSESVQEAFRDVLEGWARYHRRLGLEGASIYDLPNDGSRDEPLRTLRTKLRVEEVTPRVEVLEARVRTELTVA